MRKAILVSSAMLVVSALVFASNDPWKSKPYQQWDERDIRKILDDSPWAKVVQVDANWKTSKYNSSDDPSQPSVAPNPPAAAGKMGGQTPTASTPAGGSATASEPGSSAAQASFVVRWVSSRTVQKAAARTAELAGQLKPEDAEKQLAQRLDVYEIAITGPDMTPFQSAADDTLKKSAVLTEKKTKQKISPTKVEVSRTADGKKIQAVAFIFPKKLDNGEPTVADDEKSVDFNCSINAAKIHTSFDVSKMQDNQGRDL